MKLLNDDKLLNHYIKMHHIDKIFDCDMRPYMDLVSFSRNEDILIAGDPMPYFYFIVDGKAKIFKTLENGKSVLIRFTRPLSELGSLELLQKNKIVDCDVQALHEAICIRLRFTDLSDVCQNDVTFYKYIISRLSHKLETSSKTATLNSSYPFKNRFASYIISITRIDEISRIDEIRFDKLTDLATYLGTSYRHLNRIIQDFEDEGIIEKRNKKFVILDYDHLESLAGGYYE